MTRSKKKTEVEKITLRDINLVEVTAKDKNQQYILYHGKIPIGLGAPRTARGTEALPELELRRRMRPRARGGRGVDGGMRKDGRVW